MNSYTLKAGNEVTRVFGLSKQSLLPMVEDAASETVESFDVAVEHAEPVSQWGPAGKDISTFTYLTKSGRAGRVTMFVKRFEHRPHGPSEAQQYRFLQAHQAPIPRMYGALLDSEEREILFLEHVDVSREALTQRTMERRRELFGVMARFHAIQPSPEYRAWLDQVGWKFAPELRGAELMLDLIWDHALKGELGESLREFSSSYRRGLRQLRSLSRYIADRCLAMPQGLVHTDLLIENVGRRHSGELVLLDLEWVRTGPRFFDAALWLTRSPNRWPLGLAQRELAQHYLEEYARWGGSPPSYEAFCDDVRLMSLAEDLRTLHWYRTAATGDFNASTPDEYTRQVRCDSLYRILTKLLAQYLLRGTNCSVLPRPMAQPVA